MISPFGNIALIIVVVAILLLVFRDLGFRVSITIAIIIVIIINIIIVNIITIIITIIITFIQVSSFTIIAICKHSNNNCIVSY